MSAQPRERQSLSPGTSVQVFSRFSAAWISGFEIATNLGDGYALRRLSDRAVLPKSFSIEDVRPHYR